MTKRRILLAAIAAAASIAILIAIAIGSGWLGHLVCERIVAALESATGGRVAVRSSHFDWRDLTAELDGVTVRQADAKAAAPFLRVERMRLQLGLGSLLGNDADLASLELIRPQFDFTLWPRGGSHSALHLRLHRFRIVQGVFQADLRKYNISARGEDLNASVTLASAHPRYDIVLSAGRLRLNSIRGKAKLHAQLENGRLTIQHLSFSTDAATLEAKGTVQSFAHPVADFTFRASFHVGQAFRPPALTSGHFALSAQAHYDPDHSWSVDGKLSGRQIAGRLRGVPLKNVSFDSDLSWTPDVARFSHLRISALGGTISGTAVVRNRRDLDFDGAVTSAKIRTAALLMTGKPLDWAGAANGHVHLTAVLGNSHTDYKLSASLRISPLAGETPVSGNLRFSYRSRGAALTFGDSQLQLPNTQLAFSGSPRGILQVTLASDNMSDLSPLLSFAPALQSAVPAWLENASLNFTGQIAGATADPHLQGDLNLSRLAWAGQTWGPIRGHLVLSKNAIELSSAIADSGSFHAGGTARIGLEDWTICPDSALHVKARFGGLDLAKIDGPRRFQISAGTASGSIDLSGSLAQPSGAIHIAARNLVARGEHLDSANLAAKLDGNRLRIERAHFTAGKASATVSGIYHRAADVWTSGNLHVKLESNGFPVGKLLRFGLAADLQVHGTAAARIANGKIEPTNADGVLTFRHIAFNGVPLGSAKVVASTSGSSVQATVSGEILHAPVSGKLRIEAAPGAPAKGELHLGRAGLAELAELVRPASAGPLPFSGWMEGGITFQGPLEHPVGIRALAHIDELQVRAKLPAEAGAKAKDLVIHNVGSLAFEIENGVAHVRSFHLGGEDTGIAVLGSIPCWPGKPMNLTVGGSAGLRIFELFDPRVRASGQSLVAATIRGGFSHPTVDGTLEIKNGSFFLDDVPNGLTAVNGKVSFNRSRATIDKLTAESGGGKLNLGGFVSFAGGGPVVYNLQASAQNVRVRPAPSMSITGNGSLRLSGTSDNSILGGMVSVSHIVLSPNSDWEGLLASASAPVPTPGNAKNFITGLQFDVHIVSAPNLQLSSSLGRDLQTQVDLQLRGTPSQPVLLGTVSANQGELKIFGAKYTINHADIHFTSPVEIEPAVDLDLQTQAHGITVNITVAGTLNKLNINYRSDPPLQPRDIIALLAVGETPGTAAHVANTPTAAETAALESSANTVLGQAITPESGRLSKLFGITNIKIDPLAQGSTVTPESRLTIQQQISRNITVTYVTNLAQTSEQIFRLEWALSRQYSVVAERDDNGEFGIDILYKKRF
ncbi:MAG: translocation/assembly module TamB domain-containing protein [Bryobacteraceae bacterium]